MRAILTDDGYLLLELAAGVFGDGDLEFNVGEPMQVGVLGEDEVPYMLIPDVDLDGRFTERVARIRRALEGAPMTEAQIERCIATVVRALRANHFTPAARDAQVALEAAGFEPRLKAAIAADDAARKRQV